MNDSKTYTVKCVRRWYQSKIVQVAGDDIGDVCEEALRASKSDFGWKDVMPLQPYPVHIGFLTATELTSTDEAVTLSSEKIPFRFTEAAAHLTPSEVLSVEHYQMVAADIKRLHDALKSITEMDIDSEASLKMRNTAKMALGYPPDDVAA